MHVRSRRAGVGTVATATQRERGHDTSATLHAHTARGISSVSQQRTAQARDSRIFLRRSVAALSVSFSLGRSTAIPTDLPTCPQCALGTALAHGRLGANQGMCTHRPQPRTKVREGHETTATVNPHTARGVLFLFFSLPFLTSPHLTSTSPYPTLPPPYLALPHLTSPCIM